MPKRKGIAALLPPTTTQKAALLNLQSPGATLRQGASSSWIITDRRGFCIRAQIGTLLALRSRGWIVRSGAEYIITPAGIEASKLGAVKK